MPVLYNTAALSVVVSSSTKRASRVMQGLRQHSQFALFDASRIFSVANNTPLCVSDLEPGAPVEAEQLKLARGT